VSPRVGGSRPAGRRVPAESRRGHRSFVRTRRGPSAVARCAVVAAAALVGAAVPAGARADGYDQLAGLADQIQAATWSQVAGAAAQPSAPELAQRITDATQAAVAGVAGVVGRQTGSGDSPKEAPRASAPHVTRARVHEKARPRPAAAAASPSLPVPPPAQIEVRPSPESRAAASDRREEKRPEAPGAARAPRVPPSPLDLPSVPVPFAMPSSAGSASSGGSPVPPLLVALAAALGWLVSEVVLRRVPSRRPVRPRRIVLPTWRPG
jgi:hypothetical protein